MKFPIREHDLLHSHLNRAIYGRNYQPQQLPADQLTRVIYAFANLQSDGTVVSSDSYADLQKHYPTDCTYCDL